jgi:prepilin-type N-terminal cleavage/methylation domain-containing protein
MRNAQQIADQAGVSDAGFSLLELVVVLTILAGVAAMALPRFGAGFGQPPRSAVQSMALQLAADLRATRAEALRSNAEQSFTLDLGRRVTWSEARPTPRLFVDGLDVDVRGPGLEWSSDRSVRVRFQATGAATGGEIVVRNSRSPAQLPAVRISIDWLTGVARIERAR